MARGHSPYRARRQAWRRSNSARCGRAASHYRRAKARTPYTPRVRRWPAGRGLAAVLSLQSIAAARFRQHAAFGDMRLGDRRVFEEIARPIGDCSVEALGALVHPLERRGRSQKLERAAHRKPFVGPMLEPRTSPGVAQRRRAYRPPALRSRRAASGRGSAAPWARAQRPAHERRGWPRGRQGTNDGNDAWVRLESASSRSASRLRRANGAAISARRSGQGQGSGP